MNDERVTVTLSHDEVLVIYAAIEGLDESPDRDVFGPATWTALWRLTGQMHKHLVEVVRPDYLERVEQARRRISGDDELSIGD